MLIEYCEESMLVLGIRVILNMNAVHLSQVVGYVLNLENICVFTSRLEVIFTAGDNQNEDQGSIPNICGILVMRRELRAWSDVRRILRYD